MKETGIVYKVDITFTDDDLDEMLELQKLLDADTIQLAIMTAVRKFLDENKHDGSEV